MRDIIIILSYILNVAYLISVLFLYVFDRSDKSDKKFKYLVVMGIVLILNNQSF